jgi:hypothetical protein
MMIDFPLNPVENQEFMASTGVRYVFHANAWVTLGGGEPPDQRYVNVAGDTMAGSLTVLYPTLPGHALNVQAGDDKYVNIVGDVMTGGLTINPPGGLYLYGNAATSAGTTYSPALNIKSDWENSYLQGYHQAGVTAGVQLVVGSSAPKVWQFRQDGALRAPGMISVPNNNWVSLNGSGACGIILDSANNLIFQIANGYHMARYGNTGAWAWNENNVQNMALDAGGNLWTRGGLTVTGQINVAASIALNNDQYVGWGGNYSHIMRSSQGHWFFNAAPDWRFYWDGTDGGWRWQSGVGFPTTNMTLDGNGALTARGSLNTGGTLYAGQSITAGTAIQTNGPEGFYTLGYADGGGYYSAGMSRSTPAYDQIRLEGFHQPGITAQMRFWVGFTLFGMRNDGSAYAPGAWQDGCDERVKADIQPITNALSKISGINGATYLRTDIAPMYSPEAIAKYAIDHPDKPPLVNPPQRRQAGFMAQSIRAVLPEAVTIGEMPPPNDPGGEGFNFISSTAVLALAVEAIKELKAEIDTLKTQIPP